MTSQSPEDAVTTTAYAEGWAAVNRLVREGSSWSGREANNALLNLGGGRFADVSATAGLDFADDGRAFARVDWDQDGDLDLWVVNRTAPQVRLLRNDVGETNRSVAFRLVGRAVNRDAIGTRVDLEVAGRRLVGLRQAGSGYISQSSAWLHFGLGSATTIDRALIRWPDGSLEEFEGIESGARYEVVQGSGELRRLSTLGTRNDLALEPGSQHPPEPTEVANFALSWRLPLPAVRWTDSTGEAHTFGAPAAPTLVNLWASWCLSCRHELSEWVKARERLQAEGLRILAVSVDEPADSPAVPAAAEEIGFWFPYGAASEPLLQLLDLVQSTVADRRRPMAVPTSFLLDGQGRLARIYKGPVEIDRLIRDIRDLELRGLESARASLPFPGRWHQGPHYPDVLQLASGLLDQEQADFARYYLDQALSVESADARNQQRRVERIATMLGRTSELQLEAGRKEEAVATLRQVVALAPDSAPAAFLLGSTLFELQRIPEAIPYLRQATEADPDLAAAWHALGVALSTQGERQPARDAYLRALEADPELGAAWLALGLHHLIGQEFEESASVFRRTLELDPRNPIAWTGLGASLCSTGNTDEGEQALRRALELVPTDGRARSLLDGCAGMAAASGTGQSPPT